MLTIGQLASYTGVTIRAVRHYHQVELLPEPERDASGYRSYDASAVVQLIKIRTLAEAGVPLARVQELLDAGPETFAAATDQIDRRLRAEIRALQEHRRRIRRLAGGDSLALPDEVVDYLGRLRALGVPEAAVESERDAWILLAARWPTSIPAIMADKVAQLADPKTIRLYQLIGQIQERGADEELLHETADLMVAMFEEADANGHLDLPDGPMDDAAYIGLLDTLATGAHPAVARLQELIAEHGWTGWTRVERSEPSA
jgi:DNA-binding transcriptional MerR regulator